MPPRLVDKDLKRRDIARAAMTVFAEHGFETASMRQVAQAAGVGKGTIYEYFRSKDEMIAAAILIWIEEMIHGARSLTEGIADPEKRLKAFVSESMAGFVKDQTAIKTAVSVFQIVLSNIENRDWFDPIQSAFTDMWEAIVQIIMDGKEKGVFKIENRKEAEMIAINLVAFLDGICLHHFSSGGRFDLMAQVDHYMKYLLEADLK